MPTIYGLRYRGAVGDAPSVFVLASQREQAQQIADAHNAGVDPDVLHLAAWDVIEVDPLWAIDLIVKHAERRDDAQHQATAQRESRVGEPTQKAETRHEADADASAAEVRPDAGPQDQGPGV